MYIIFYVILVGFSSDSCDNEVRIGDYTCVASSQSDTEIVCNLDSSEQPDVGVSLPVTVSIMFVLLYVQMCVKISSVAMLCL